MDGDSVGPTDASAMSQEQPSATRTPATDGYNARLFGHGLSECPYDLGSDRPGSWFEGWKAADAERLADAILECAPIYVSNEP